MNTTLSWKIHIYFICKRRFASVHTLKTFYNCFPAGVKVMLVKPLVFPQFNYCSVVINAMTKGLSLKLQRAQNHFILYYFN